MLLDRVQLKSRLLEAVAHEQRYLELRGGTPEDLNAPIVTPEDLAWLLSLEHAASLRGIDLSHNCLPALPTNLERLQALQTLDVSHNHLEEFPSGITWPALVRLDISCNWITDLPADLSSWETLQTLTLAYNTLSESGRKAVVSSVSVLRNLQHLDLTRVGLTNTEFAMLMESIGSEPWQATLSTLIVGQNCPGSLLPHFQSASDWRSYWQRRKRRQHFHSLRFARVLVLGQGRSGKTHLCIRALNGTHLSLHFDATSPSTQGLRVFGDPFVVAEGSDTGRVRYQVCDFGGQPYLHAAHRMFLTRRRAVYIVTYDATRSRKQNRLDYWLRFIRREVSLDSPVIVVITKEDLFDATTKRFVKEKQDTRLINEANIRAIAGLPAATRVRVIHGMGWSHANGELPDKRVSACRHLKAVRSLRRAVQESCSEVPGYGDQFRPEEAQLLFWLVDECFMRIHESAKWLEGRDFLKQAAVFGIEQSRLRLLLDTAYEMGSVLPCPNDVSGWRIHGNEWDIACGRLFNPEWVIGAVYRVVSSDHLRSRGGVVSRLDLERALPLHTETWENVEAQTLWDHETFTSEDREAILKLLEAYEVICDACRPSPGCTYVIPDLLRARRGKDRERGLNGEWMWVREFEWLPEVYFGRLLGRLAQSSSELDMVAHRDALRVTIRKGVRMEVRFEPAEIAVGKRRGRTGQARIYVSFSRIPSSEKPGPLTRADTAQSLSAVDSELRSILGESAFGQSQWRHLRGADVSSQGKKRTERARAAYDVLVVRANAMRPTIGTWEMLIQFAEQLLQLDSGDLLDRELSQAEIESLEYVRDHPELFCDYCQKEGRGAFWSTQWGKHLLGTAVDTAGQQQKQPSRPSRRKNKPSS